MTTEKNETDWAAEIGRPTAANLRELVAALELDYDRLTELRNKRDGFVPPCCCTATEHGPDTCDQCGCVQCWDTWDDVYRIAAWAEARPDDAEELKELEAAACPCGNPCKDREDAERMIHDDALAVEVRSGWCGYGEEMRAEEFAVLLSTGGPATRIRGELDEHGEPHRAWLEVQDWFKPWTEYFEPGLPDVLLAYARCFVFAS